MKKIDLTSAAVDFTEWFSGIAILNLSWLLFSLPIFTLIPATDAVFEVMHDWKKNGQPKNIFKTFKYFFKTNFKQSYKLGIPILVVLAIIAMDLYFLSYITLPQAWFQILKYAFYTFSILILLTFLYLYPLSKWKEKYSFRLFTISFMLVVGNPKITLAVLMTLMALFFIFSWFPAMLFFVSMSGLAWLGETAIENIFEN